MSGLSNGLHDEGMVQGEVNDIFLLGLNVIFMYQGACLGDWTHILTRAFVSTCSPIPSTHQVLLFAKSQ